MALANPAANSWRLNVKEIDKSSTVIGEAGGVGAMVIEASRGPLKPQYISKGQESRILNLFGNPSPTYPEVWEAIQYNYQDVMYISAPYSSDAKLGGVLVHEGGSEGLGAGIAPASLSNYSFDSDNEYFVLTSKSPCVDWLGVIITYTEETQLFKITLYEDDDGTWVKIRDYTVSPIEGKKDGFGKVVFIEDVLENDDYLQAVANTNADLTGSASGFTDDSSTVAFTGGTRGSTIAISDRNDGWDYFKKFSQYPVDVFMDTSKDNGIVTTFNTLKNTYQKYSFYVLPLPMSEDVSTATTTKQEYGVSNDGLAFYWNHAKIKNTYGGSNFWTSLIGKIGAKLAQMQDIYNGGAPAWIDENNHGGQLGAGIIETEYDPTESELESLDNAGINPIKFYPGYGTMIASQRTAQSPNSLSDTSWIAHRRLFDYMLANIISQVLIFQIVKLNDDYHRRLAISKGITIMDPILAENLIADYAIQCDSNNNDDNALAQRQFVYTLALKVTPYSETIVFNFVHIGQTTEVSEIITSG